MGLYTVHSGFADQVVVAVEFHRPLGTLDKYVAYIVVELAR